MRVRTEACSLYSSSPMHISLFQVYAATNGFQKFAISFLKMKFSPILKSMPFFEKVILAIQETSTSCCIIHIQSFSILQMGRGSALTKRLFAIFLLYQN